MNKLDFMPKKSQFLAENYPIIKQLNTTSMTRKLVTGFCHPYDTSRGVTGGS